MQGSFDFANRFASESVCCAQDDSTNLPIERFSTQVSSQKRLAEPFDFAQGRLWATGLLESSELQIPRLGAAKPRNPRSG